MTQCQINNRIYSIFFSLTLLLILNSCGNPRVELAQIFQSDMVLQRDTVNVIWGFAEPGISIGLEFDGKSYTTQSNDEGKWSIPIDPHPAGGSYTLKIKSSNNLTLENITFGEVWLCGGQSNMQYTLRMLNKDLSKIPELDNDQIRVFQGAVNTDYQSPKDLSGGNWQLASSETVPDFSAAAYFFARELYDSLKVPVGILSINLGATTIETWMSRSSLEGFPQFEQALAESAELEKSFELLNEEFEAFRTNWDTDYYKKGPGFDQAWYEEDTPDEDWKTLKVPNFWEYEGLDHDGAVWFRKEFDIPAGFSGDSLMIHLNQIDDYDMTWVNGQLVGETFGNRNFRNYWVPKSILKEKGNQLTVRVFDIGGLGGFHTAAFWGNPILLGEWKYKAGLKIEAESFPKPVVPNGSIFSFPGLLYNGSLAPLKGHAIRGALWYQGEGNEFRAEEYRELLPALIKGWCDDWGYSFPFLIVQLANYKQQVSEPRNSNWAEIREAQYKASQEKDTYIISAIDLGEANDIHPHNKEDVGKRLALMALSEVYDFPIQAGSPYFESFEVRKDTLVINLQSRYGPIKVPDRPFIRGFHLAGEDGKFYNAKALLEGHKLKVFSGEVKAPAHARYAWADNPGELDLYTESGWPVLPFRTDSWPLGTKGQVYNHTPHQF